MPILWRCSRLSCRRLRLAPLDSIIQAPCHFKVLQPVMSALACGVSDAKRCRLSRLLKLDEEGGAYCHVCFGLRNIEAQCCRLLGPAEQRWVRRGLESSGKFQGPAEQRWVWKVPESSGKFRKFPVHEGRKFAEGSGKVGKIRILP